MTRNKSKARLGIFLALTMILSVFAMGFAGAAPADDLDFDGDDAAPNPEFVIDEFTKARHPASQGLSDDAMAGIYDDNGDWVDDPEFSVNTSSPEEGVNENPYTFKPGHVDDEDFGIFPRTGLDDEGEQLASALDAGEWSTDESGSTDGTVSVSDSEVAEGADAVRIEATGMSSGDTVTATYNNWTSELDSDEEKRVLQLGADVDTLDSGALVEINVTDEAGNEKTVTIDPDANASEEDVLADATGDSYVTQVKLSDLTGDDLNNIESLDVSVNDADADVSFAWIDLESKSKDVLGVETVDSDDDGDYDETNEIYQAQGSISVNSMTSVGPEFDNAVFNDVTFPATSSASMLNGAEGPKGAYQYQFDSADSYPSYDTVFNVSYRMELPGYIDASYSGVSLEMDQGWTTERFTKFGYAEGVSDETEFADVELTDVSGNLDGSGETVTIDDTVQIDTGYVITAHIRMTDDEKPGVINEGGAAPPASGDSGFFGGIIDFITSLPGALMAIGGSILGIRAWKSG